MALVDEHKKLLFKVANVYCRDHLAREDLVQEIVANMWSSFDRYDDRLRFSTWMYRIALNVAISSYRREKRHAKNTVQSNECLLESIPAPIDPADRDEERQILDQFILELNELDKALMILYLEQKQHDEIAAILGISASNVATKIGRIKNKLRAQVHAGHTP